LESVITALFLIFIFIIIAVVRALKGPARYDVVLRGGAPYCPRCNRQVSYRRDHCRSCGYTFVSYGPTPEEIAQEKRSWKQAAEFQEGLLKGKQQRARAEKERRAQERAQRRAERDAYYLDRGIKPGPFAWYQLLPDWQQAILLGIACAAPVSLLITIFIIMRNFF
jgi:hypothetical protein